MNVYDTGASAVDEAGEHWWLGLLLGIIAIGAGLVAIVAPFTASVVVGAFIGVMLVIGGVVTAVHAVARRVRATGMMLGLLVAAFYVIAGLYLLAAPVRGVLVLTLALGIFYVVSGAVRIISAIASQHLPNWHWELTGGILALILGVIIWSGWPASATWAIGLIVGIDLIFLGWTIVTLSVAAHTVAGAHGRRLAGQH